jgi:uroporphyrinogen decarboxylase
MPLKYEPLPREAVADAIHGKGLARPPAFMHKWPGQGLRELHGDALMDVLDRYPDDVVCADLVSPGGWRAPEGMDAEYRWAFRDADAAAAPVGHDAGAGILADWSELDAFLEHLPGADDPRIFQPVRDAVARAEGRYVIARSWGYFYERLWGLRGMQNLLMDFHLHAEEVHRLADGLLAFARQLVAGAAEAGADGFMTSNDLGHQTGLMMGPRPYREFLKPRTTILAGTAHDCGLDFWLHSCGNLTDVLGDLAEAGVDCLHPLQYGAMDWGLSARVLDGRLTAWPGADVQHVLPERTPEEVRAHVRELIDTFYRPGRLVVAAGNGIIPPTSLENVDAFLDEVFRYGLEVAGSSN